MFRNSKPITTENVEVLTREGILNIENPDLKYTFGDIPDASFDMKTFISALLKHEFRIGENVDYGSEYTNIVKQLKTQIGNINTDYVPFQKIIEQLDPNETHQLKERLDKLYNRVLFFQVDSLLLDFARYVFSYYAVLQLNSIQSMMKRIYSALSNDGAAAQLKQLTYLEPTDAQMQGLMYELDTRIEEHRGEVDSKKKTNLQAQQQVPEQNAEAQPQQGGQNSNYGSNPIRDLTSKFADSQLKFIQRRKQFKAFVVMLIELMSTSLEQLIGMYRTLFDTVQVEEDLRTNLLDIVSKIEGGLYNLNTDENIEKDLREIDSEMVRQLGKRGTIRYKNILNEVNKLVKNISEQNNIVSKMS